MCTINKKCIDNSGKIFIEDLSRPLRLPSITRIVINSGHREIGLVLAVGIFAKRGKRGELMADHKPAWFASSTWGEVETLHDEQMQADFR